MCIHPEIPAFSKLTFGTTNWTVRDIPPSHDAISIIKPVKKTFIIENLMVEFQQSLQKFYVFKQQ